MARLGFAVALALLAAPAARAQSVLPQTGTSAQIGTLRQQVEDVVETRPGLRPAAPGWTVSPWAGLEQQWTDHVRNAGGDQGSSFITVLRPGLTVDGESARLKGTLRYAPEVFLYSAAPSQNRVGQNLTANGLVTAIPERLFLDLRGFAALQSTTAGRGLLDATTYGRRNETQSYSFSATPYLRHRFGDLAQAEAGVGLSRTVQDSLANGTWWPGQSVPSTFQAADQQATIAREYLSVRSGPALGRTSAALLANAMQSRGTGVMDGARRASLVGDVGYAVTRSLTALGRIGYEDIRYAGLPPVRITGPVWSVGGRWAPDPDTAVTLRYGFREGFHSATLDGVWAPTARTRVFARYSEGLSTDLEELQETVAAAVLDPMGRPVDAATGAPLLLAGGFFGVQNNLARTKRASLTGMLLLERDTVSFTLSRQDSTQVAAASVSGLGNLSNTGAYGMASWQHDIGPNLSSVAAVQYGATRYRTAGGTWNGHPLSLELGLTYAASESVSTWLRYGYTSDGAGLARRSWLAPSPAANLVVAGISKRF